MGRRERTKRVGGRGDGKRRRRNRKICHIIHESGLRVVFICSMSIYSLTGFNMNTLSDSSFGR